MNNRELWIFLFALGTILLNWPFLNIFSLSLPYYLFGFWAGFILLVGFFIAKAPPSNQKKNTIV